MLDALDRLSPQASFTILTLGHQVVSVPPAQFLRLAECLSPASTWRRQLSYHWLTADPGLTALSAAGRALISPHLDWRALMLERESERILEAVRLSPSILRPSELYTENAHDAHQAEVMAAALFWLVLDDIIILDWSGRLLMRHFDDDERIAFEIDSGAHA